MFESNRSIPPYTIAAARMRINIQIRHVLGNNLVIINMEIKRS